MPWLIWPPQASDAPLVRITNGAPENWPNLDAYKAFNGLTVTGEGLPMYRLPPTRNVETAHGKIALPKHFLALAHDANGKLSLDPIETMPDVVFGAGYSWFVSAKVKALLQDMAGNAVRFEPQT